MDDKDRVNVIKSPISSFINILQFDTAIKIS